MVRSLSFIDIFPFNTYNGRENINEVKMMRVIAGSARRLQLKTIDGLDTRPTTDRIKETLFNMIDHGLGDSYFLDLFAGSGGIGIEALSRGAKHAVFAEKNPKAAACIKENLEHTKLAERAEVMQTDYLNAMSRLEGKYKFEYIYMDPPYRQGFEKRALEYLSGSALLSDDGIIIVEAALDTEFDYAKELGFLVIKSKVYKTNKHVFLEKERKELC